MAAPLSFPGADAQCPRERPRYLALLRCPIFTPRRRCSDLSPPCSCLCSALLLFPARAALSGSGLGLPHLSGRDDAASRQDVLPRACLPHALRSRSGVVGSVTHRKPWIWAKPALALAMLAVSAHLRSDDSAHPQRPPLSCLRTCDGHRAAEIRAYAAGSPSPALRGHVRLGGDGAARGSYYHTLSPEEQRKTAIFANNYGEGGAIDFFGPKYGLPKAIGGHQNYWIWGPRDYTGESMIVLGEGHEQQYADEMRQLLHRRKCAKTRSPAPTSGSRSITAADSSGTSKPSGRNSSVGDDRTKLSYLAQIFSDCPETLHTRPRRSASEAERGTADAAYAARYYTCRRRSIVVARQPLHPDAIEHQIHPERRGGHHCGRLASQPVRPIRSAFENARRSMSGGLPESPLTREAYGPVVSQ